MSRWLRCSLGMATRSPTVAVTFGSLLGAVLAHTSFPQQQPTCRWRERRPAFWNCCQRPRAPVIAAGCHHWPADGTTEVDWLYVHSNTGLPARVRSLPSPQPSLWQYYLPRHSSPWNVNQTSYNWIHYIIAAWNLQPPLCRHFQEHSWAKTYFNLNQLIEA